MVESTKLFSIARSAPVQAVIGLFLAASLWEAARVILHLQPIFLPSLSAIGYQIAEFLTTWDGAAEIGISLQRVALGFSLSAVIALPIAIVFTESRSLNRIFSPVIEFIRYIPIICFVPISIYWLGLSESQKIFVLVLGTFCQLVPMAHSALSEVSNEVIDVYSALHRGRRGLVAHVLLPSAAPRIWDALRISLGIAWTYLIVAEVVGATSGLGFSIVQAQRYLQSDRLFAAMVIIGLIGVACDGLMKSGKQLLFPWHRP